VTDRREMAFRDIQRDDPARFLRELRELRSHAGLGQAELAARAHYPCEAIKAAEAGPALPDLPVLSAYVRGCGGTLAEWEERWRAVTGSPASPLLTTRETGCSEAADAGARVGAASAFAALSGESDGQGADRVMAALDKVADGYRAAAPPVASALSGLAEYVPQDPGQDATGAAKVAMDVWTPAAAIADSALTTTPPTITDGGLTTAPPTFAHNAPAVPPTIAGGEPAAEPSARAHNAPAATPPTLPQRTPAAAPPVVARNAPVAPAVVARGRVTASGAWGQDDPSARPRGSRRVLAAVAVVTLLLVVILLAVFS
jgi:Helix-turn-helix domain